MLIIGLVAVLLCIYFLKGAARSDTLHQESQEPWIAVDYEEFYPDTYRGVIVENLEKEITRYHTGNFDADLAQAQKDYPNAFVCSDTENFKTDRLHKS